MGQLIDRRLNGKNKSAVNRQRFIRRFKKQIKKAVTESISERSIVDIDSSEHINIPARDISEPVFHHGPGGSNEAGGTYQVERLYTPPCPVFSVDPEGDPRGRVPFFAYRTVR